MADNNLGNDEYEFADLDGLSPDLMGENDNLSTPSNFSQSSQGSQRSEKKDVKRNALIVIVLIVILMLLYKFMGPFFTKKTDSTQPNVSANTPVIQPTQQPDIQPAVTVESQTQPQVQIQTPPQVTQAVTQTVTESPELTQKLASMDLNQQNIRSDVNNVSNQLGGINSNINALNAKIANLNQMVTSLSATVQQQSNQIASLIALRTQQAKKQAPVRHVVAARPLFHIQAVIPGRAWLIAANGSTLTVREGTIVAGYGVVKLIDPVQGRVVTSSGRVIRFSQQDS